MCLEQGYSLHGSFYSFHRLVLFDVINKVLRHGHHIYILAMYIV